MHTETGIAAELAERVRSARKVQGLRQDELAMAAGVSTRSVHMIEHAKPTTRLDTLAKVLAALGLTLTAQPRSRLAQPRDGER